ncbi:hypothetical protein NMG60_11025267 [Bertholletia excelsa]
MHGSNREDGGEDSSEESVNDEDEEEEDEAGGGGAVRILPPNPVTSMPASLSNHHHQQRKNFPSSATAKMLRPTQGWKPADEMIYISVPRKARSASTKRSNEYYISGGGVGGDQIHRQASTSPVRPNLVSTSTPSPAPLSPSSSNASVRKKMKPNGHKPRPPKSSSKSSSSNPEELEIEIAEVLYGLMTQSQSTSKKEAMADDSAKFDSREVNKSSSDAKSRVSSPISNSTSTAPQSSTVLQQNSSSSATLLSAVAPKRKRPRQISDNLANISVRNSAISSTTTATVKAETDQAPKTEISSPNLDRNLGYAAENGGVSHDFAGSQAVPPLLEPPPPESAMPETVTAISESKESRDVGPAKDEVVTYPKKESPVVGPEDDREEATVTKANSTVSDIESQRKEKYQIDLMAPPPQSRSSPERDSVVDFASAAEQKPVVPDSDAEMKSMTKDKEDEKDVRYEAVDIEPEPKKVKATPEAEPEKPILSKERTIDIQLDLEKPERDTGKQPHAHKQQQQPSQLQPKATKDEPQHIEKSAQSSSLPLPISMPSWPGGLHPMGYMAPLQGVVSMDGSAVPSPPIQPWFSQPRPKRCATHCYIARSIHSHQQLMKFWPASAGSASLFGAKPCNLNVMPSAELHGNIAGRSSNPVPDKGQGLAIFPGHSGKEKASQAANMADAPRKQQILLQQGLPPGVPSSNIMHGPAFIFPLNQQQAAAAVAAAASARHGPSKCSPAAGSVPSTSVSNSASANGSATAAPTVSFNYPNMPASETQYLAILQNNAYPFPIPAVGASPAYRGPHPQAVPYFNGSFYSSPMIHPSQLQHQQQQQQPPSAQLQQMQHSHQSANISSGSSSSQKHLQSQQQRPQGSSTNGGNGNGNLHNFPAAKNRPSQSSQQPNQHLPTTHHGRPLETEVCGEDSPSTADSRARATMSVYGQNFAVPIHHQNFTLMTPPSALASTAGGNQGDKKQQQQQSQQQGLKAGVESITPQTFAVSFTSVNGATPSHGIDISSVAAQNHQILQSLPEGARHNYQIMQAAAVAQAAAQQKKNFRVSEEGKTGGGDSYSSVDEEKKGLAGKSPSPVGLSIAFSRPDLTDVSVSTMPGSNVVDSSARPVNLVSASSRTSRSAVPNANSTLNTPNTQLQALQFQQQQMMQLQKQHSQQQWNKTLANSNGSVYGESLTSSSTATAKFPNPLSGFPQNFVQSSSSGSSPAQSPQWKNSARTGTQAPSSLASSTTSLKNLPLQQQARTQQNHTQISFGTSQKSSTGPTSNTHQSPSPPVVASSPTTSSISKSSTGGSPRTTAAVAAVSAAQGSKAPQPSALSSSQQPKNSSIPNSCKSSPVGGRNVPSILGNPGTKPQLQQQQLPKQTVSQSQLYFSSAYMQAQAQAQAPAPHTGGSSSTASATSGYYIPSRRRPEQQQSSSGTSMLSLCPPVTLAAANTSDAKVAAAAAASNMKGGAIASQSVLHATTPFTQSSGNSHQLLPGGFSFVHAVPATVPVKPADQKQSAGNDNLHACWQPEKK